MKRKIKVNRKAHIAYLPDEVIRELVPGEESQSVDAYADAITLTLVKPGATLSQVKRSLEVVLQDLDVRIEDANKTDLERAAQPAR
jgi:hypothetical protein